MMYAKTYISRTEKVEAFQWGVDTPPLWFYDARRSGHIYCTQEGVTMHTLTGTLLAQPNDWILKDELGNIRFCSNPYFKEHYVSMVV